MISTCHSPLRQPIVPNARPTSQIASAQPLSSRSVTSGTGRRGEVEVLLEPAQHRVAHRPADQGDLLAGRLEAGAELVDHRCDPEQLLDGAALDLAHLQGLVGHGETD